MVILFQGLRAKLKDKEQKAVNSDFVLKLEHKAFLKILTLKGQITFHGDQCLVYENSCIMFAVAPKEICQVWENNPF